MWKVVCLKVQPRRRLKVWTQGHLIPGSSRGAVCACHLNPQFVVFRRSIPRCSIPRVCECYGVSIGRQGFLGSLSAHLSPFTDPLVIDFSLGGTARRQLQLSGSLSELGEEEAIEEVEPVSAFRGQMLLNPPALCGVQLGECRAKMTARSSCGERRYNKGKGTGRYYFVHSKPYKKARTQSYIHSASTSF